MATSLSSNEPRPRTRICSRGWHLTLLGHYVPRKNSQMALSGLSASDRRPRGKVNAVRVLDNCANKISNLRLRVNTR